MNTAAESAIQEARNQTCINKINEMKKKGLAMGKRLEIVVSEKDITFDDMLPTWFISSHYNRAYENIPEAHYPHNQKATEVKISGYVGKIDEDGFRLCFAWDQDQNKPLSDNGNASYLVYGNAVREYTFPKDR